MFVNHILQIFMNLKIYPSPLQFLKLFELILLLIFLTILILKMKEKPNCYLQYYHNFIFEQVESE